MIFKEATSAALPTGASAPIRPGEMRDSLIRSWGYDGLPAEVSPAVPARAGGGNSARQHLMKGVFITFEGNRQWQIDANRTLGGPTREAGYAPKLLPEPGTPLVRNTPYTQAQPSEPRHDRRNGLLMMNAVALNWSAN
jgi:hypothetical protein